MLQMLERRADDREVPSSSRARDSISQSWSSYQLNQLGSKAASDSTQNSWHYAACQILVLCTLLYVLNWAIIIILIIKFQHVFVVDA